jgi:hypothetical protein
MTAATATVAHQEANPASEKRGMGAPSVAPLVPRSIENYSALQRERLAYQPLLSDVFDGEKPLDAYSVHYRRLFSCAVSGSGSAFFMFAA